VIVVGLSHRTAPMSLLERTAQRGSPTDLLGRMHTAPHVAEAVVLSTCNRLEVYAEVSRFHGGITDIAGALADGTQVPLSELTDHLYVHYEQTAVSHLFRVICGLDSMAIGEAQILGQVRSALKLAQDTGSAGRVVGHLMQQALRVGKRARTETRLDRAGASLVEAGLQQAEANLGPLPEAAALVLGAGAMAGLVVASLQRAEIGAITVVSRTTERAERLALSAGGRALPMSMFPQALAGADLVVSSAGAGGYLVDAAAAASAQAERAGRRQLYLDLALPRDVDPKVAELAGVELVDLEVLGRQLASSAVQADLDGVETIIGEEVAAFAAAQRAAGVAPTVVALRAHARAVVEAELQRLAGRLGTVDERVQAEIEATVHRVVEKLLHTPTVRVKQLAGEPGGRSYAEALRDLFDLDLERITAVTGPAEEGDR